MDVLLITGMRDEALVAALSHLVPHSRLLEVRIKANKQSRRARQGCDSGDYDGDDNGDNNSGGSKLMALEYRPSFIFDNDTIRNEAAKGLPNAICFPSSTRTFSDWLIWCTQYLAFHARASSSAMG